MNVTVFGATGAIGSLTVAELLADGHAVTVYVREPAKIPGDWADHVRVVVGTMADPEAIDSAVSGADAVVSALGPSMDRRATGLPLVTGTQHIVDAMQSHGVARYIGLATPSILDPRETPTAQTRLISFLGRHGLPRAYRELLGMTEVVVSSELDWTIVRFTAPTNAPATGKIRVGFYGTESIGFRVSRGDIAAFVAAQVGDRTFCRRAPAISN